MPRRMLLPLAFVMLCACTREPEPLAMSLPETLPGGWTRGAINTTADVPPQAAALGVRDSAETTYTSGERRVEVTLIRMQAETSAFELMQQWRHAEAPAKYNGALFYIARGADREAATAVLQALPQSGGGQSPK